jgi:hypothetical protein
MKKVSWQTRARAREKGPKPTACIEHPSNVWQRAAIQTCRVTQPIRACQQLVMSFKVATKWYKV